jgi:flagellar hook assembly protein FlgD
VGCYNGGIRYFQASDNTGFKQQPPDQSSFITFSVYPNPVHGSAQIQYSLQRPANVQITLYSILGEKIRLLENSFRVQGSHTIHWDGTDEQGHPLPGGSYICTIRADDFTEMIKLLIVE